MDTLGQKITFFASNAMIFILHRIAWVCCVLLCLMTPAAAQYRHGFTVRGLFSNYLTSENIEFKPADVYGRAEGIGLEVAYTNYFAERVAFSVPLKWLSARPGTIENPDVPREALFTADGLIVFDLLPRGAWVNFDIGFGLGVSRWRDSSYTDFNFPIGATLALRLGPHVRLNVASQYRTTAIDRGGWHHAVGVGYAFGKIKPKPEEPDELPPPPPPRPADRDRDGVPDDSDVCPDLPGPPAREGCPDRDGDGVYDPDDRCPGIPGKVSLQGCPDRDNDGLADAEDACPDLPGPRAQQGCPDTDGDGLHEGVDRCPERPGPAANNGCPEVKAEDRETLNLAVRMVQFETGKAVLLPSSLPVLDEMAAILERYPDYRLEIRGHTDDVGEAAFNQALSEQRAKACYDYLAGRGAPAARLQWAGFGESRPVADNATPEGREKNRRVEFELILK